MGCMWQFRENWVHFFFCFQSSKTSLVEKQLQFAYDIHRYSNSKQFQKACTKLLFCYLCKQDSLLCSRHSGRHTTLLDSCLGDYKQEDFSFYFLYFFCFQSRSLCSTLLSAQINLLAYFQCLMELLPDNHRMDIGKNRIFDNLNHYRKYQSIIKLWITQCHKFTSGEIMLLYLGFKILGLKNELTMKYFPLQGW